MRTLSEKEVVDIRELVRQMVVLTEDRGYDFIPAWTQKHGWVVVPVEDSGHFAEEEISRIVAVLGSQERLTCLPLGRMTGLHLCRRPTN